MKRERRLDLRGMLAVVPLAAAIACSEDGPCDPGSGDCLHKTDAKLIAVDAQLGLSEARAGQLVPASCIGRYDDGTTAQLLPPAAELTADPTLGVHIEGAQLSATQAGSYLVRCRAPETSEGMSATLTITAGEPARMLTTLDRPQVASGESASALCQAVDAYGNPLPGLVATRLVVEPSDGVQLSAFSVRGVRAGAYAVACAIDSPPLERVPATLEVLPGAPVSIRTVLSDDSVFAGDRVEVHCLVADAAGNEVATDTRFEVRPAPDLQDSSGLVATAVGDYQVSCAATTISLVSDPELLTVAPALPAQLRIVQVDPAKPVYKKGEVVELSVRITDSYANEVQTAAWEISSLPAGGAAFAGLHRVELTLEGAVQLLARVSSMTAGGAEVADAVSLMVDGTPPVVSITFPERGEIVAGPGGQPLTILGTVADPLSGVASLIIGGQAVAVDPSGNFQASFNTSWGIDLIEGTASDGAGNTRDFAQSFEYAEGYRRASPTRLTSGKIADGLLVRVGQAVLDDNAADIDDLATIARLAIENADLNALIPDPVTTYNSDCSVLFVTITGALRLYVDDVRFGTPVIDIQAISGGLHLRVEVPNLAVDLHTSGDVCDIGLGISGTASANRAVIEGDLLVTRSGGALAVTMPSATVTLSGFGINLNLPSIIDWAVDGILSLFSGAIADRLETALSDVIRSEVPPVVQGFLGSLSIATQVALPSPLSLSLGVSSRLGSAGFAAGGGTIGLDTTLYASGTITPEPLGGILQDTHQAPSFGARPFAVGISYDLINQALYSIWYGGALDLDLTQFIPGALPSNGQMLDVTATAHALLPPVLAPSGDPQYPVELQIGDLQLDLAVTGIPNLPMLSATVYATAYARATAVIGPAGDLQLSLAPNPRVSLDFMTNLGDALEVANLVAQLEGGLAAFLPVLFGQVVGGIPIPSFDISSLAAGNLPPGIVLGLGNAQTAFTPSYLILQGDLVQRP